MSETEKCPVCKSTNVLYGSQDFESNSLAYEIECLDCGWSGFEVYSVNFMYYTDKEGKPVEEK